MSAGLTTLLSSPDALLLMLLAIPIGMVFGAIPGLGGKIALISVMPFLTGMDPLAGCVFLISLHAVVHTGAAAPTILLGIPGTGPSTAVVLDGHAMTKRGEGTRAIAAAAFASGVGGVVGMIALALIVPFALTLMTHISYPEIFVLTLFGLGFAAVLSGRYLVKGLIVTSLGLLISFVGTEPTYGVQRLTFGSLFLIEGVDLITAVLAMFAVPEMLTAKRGQQRKMRVLENDTSFMTSGVLSGLRDIVRHRWLTLRSSVLGVIVGIIPGLGGDVAAWLCYGHAAQTSRTPEKFGKGAVEGVIGPEAANNSKEGGALVPTLFLGIPGSSGMAIFLVALVPLGIAPGISFAERHSDLVWAMVWALAVSNVIAALVLILLARGLQRLAQVPPHILTPFVYLLALASIYITTQEWRFFLVLGAFSVVGYLFLRLDWPRAPFVIGLILGPETEEALVKSLSLWGTDFLLRPVAFGLVVVLLVSIHSLPRRLSRRAAQTQEAMQHAD
ncbi:MAG: tripartite tricarboxylate transporter permease [Rhodobacteraceae bacterium]|nr:tripartite tricarboxylate transporter permease [Paracoccaceae bacterium]